MRPVLLLQLACTLMMTGIIWFVQVVHYPLFARVGQQGFAVYEAEHATRTGWVVAPLMCVELGAAFLFLVPRFRPSSVPGYQAAIGAVLVTIVWLSTALIQVPLHGRLGAGYDADVISRLVSTNWIRTIAWTLRACLVLLWSTTLTR